jgi:hypothetical protein
MQMREMLATVDKWIISSHTTDLLCRDEAHDFIPGVIFCRWDLGAGGLFYSTRGHSLYNAVRNFCRYLDAYEFGSS